MIAPVIIEMCALLLVKDCIISCYYHPTQGDYSGSPNFKMAALRFVNVTKEVNGHDRRKFNSKEGKSCY